MEERPQGLQDADVRDALTEVWQIETAEMDYVPLGGGSYHWKVSDAGGDNWFVSATDLDHAPWLGADRTSSLETLRSTMEAAVSLRDPVGHAFVLAPVPCPAGGVARVICERYGFVVHPFIEGRCGDFGSALRPEDQAAVGNILADLHSTSTSAVGLHPMVELDAHEWVDERDPTQRRMLDRYEALGEAIQDRAGVITHGEPHAGNLMSVGESSYLIDWDTAAVALPERDLHLLLDHGNSDILGLYEDRTGHVADPAALTYYRLRWALEELAWAVREGDTSAIRSAVEDGLSTAGL